MPMIAPSVRQAILRVGTTAPDDSPQPRPPCSDSRSRSDKALVEDFIRTRLRRVRGRHLSAQVLFAALERYCGEERRPCPSPQLLGRRLRARGFESFKEGRMFYLDVAVTEELTS
jgi:hypothetical protein